MLSTQRFSDICYTVPPKPGEQLTKAQAGYSNAGPFTCGNCSWFEQLPPPQPIPTYPYDPPPGPVQRTMGNCDVVGYPIAKQGCCDFWHGAGDNTPDTPGTPQNAGMEKVEYVEVTGAHYTCDECIFFDAIRETCWPVKGHIEPKASCNKWMPNYSALNPSGDLPLDDYAAIRQSIRSALTSSQRPEG